MNRIGKDLLEQHQGTGNQQRCAQALDDACGHQRCQARRETACEGGHREDAEARHEDPLGADPVPERARGQEECREDQRVGIDHPLQPGDIGAEIDAQRLERHVHDTDIEQHHDEAQARGDQGPALVAGERNSSHRTAP